MDNLLNDNILEITDFEIVRTDGERFVVFFIDDDAFAVSSKFVAEVDRLLAVTPLPNLPNWFCGIANLRGDIVSVVDLRPFWNRTSTTALKGKTLILQSKRGSTRIAFVVDRIGEINILEESECEVFAEAEIQSPLPHIYGKANLKNQTLYLLDVEKLLSSPKLQNLLA
jgi:purine-binding chemotaxis protein CheW